MNWILFGTPMHALFMMNNGMNPKLIVHGGIKEDHYLEMEQQANLLKIAFLIPESVNSPDLIPECDLILSMNFPKRIPQEIISKAKWGAINCHPSLLPKLRGANPYFWTMRNEYVETGVTLHHLVHKFDAGKVILQEKIAIHPADTLGSLYRKLSSMQRKICLDFLKSTRIKKVIPPGENQIGEPTKAPLVKSKDLRIDPNWNKQQLEKLIRSTKPFLFPWIKCLGFKLYFRNLSFSPNYDESDKKGSVFFDEGKVFLFLKDGTTFKSANFEISSNSEEINLKEGKPYALMD